uniref:exodeoxyribonuclease III n=1 Tax=Myripristis murdjan TaxID=586833 RepID=A0A667ZXY0_9TELE
MVMNKIKVISWNINGIQNPVKRFKVLSHLKSLDCDIALLQETHLSKEESLKLKQRWVGQIFFSPGTSASKGVCILIAKKILFTVLDVITDKEGRWVIVSGELENNKIILMNLYAPNLAQASFLTSINVLLTQFKNIPLLVGGDFNLVSNALMDRSSPPLPADKSLSQAFKELLETQSINDVWRLFNTKSREYTFYSKSHNSYSR